MHKPRILKVFEELCQVEQINGFDSSSAKGFLHPMINPKTILRVRDTTNPTFMPAQRPRPLNNKL